MGDVAGPRSLAQPSAELYQAILARHSVRRYDQARLDEATLDQVRGIVRSARPLVPGARFDAVIGTIAPGEDPVRALGGYGQLTSPPHYLAPYIAGERCLLADLGHRAEQVAVRLTMLGLGSCFVGCLRGEESIRARFGLPEGARIAAFLIFGRPSAGLRARAIDALISKGAGAQHKLPVERVFYRDTFDNPAAPPPELLPLVEAARHAPSAVNAQPWRFVWRDGHLHLFVKRRNSRYLGGAAAQYNLFDGGLCMGNVTLALEALGMEGRWVPYEGAAPAIPDHPAALLPLAMLALGSR